MINAIYVHHMLTSFVAFLEANLAKCYVFV